MKSTLTPTERQVLHELSDGAFHTGTDLSLKLGLSRTAIWKSIRSLEQLDLAIIRDRKRGYCLPYPIRLLDKLKILPRLSQDCHLDLFTQIGSTCDYAKSHPELSAPRIIIAEQQLAGHGRWGRPWISPFACHLAYTLLWDYYGPTQYLSSLSLKMALSLVRALQDFGLRGLQVKWPNDLLYEKKKLAGILIQSQSEHHGCTRLLISIGLNVGPVASTQVDRPITSLYEITHRQIDRNDLTVTITQQLFRDLAELTLKQDRDWIQDWNRLDALANQPIQLYRGTEVIHGIARGINEYGELIIEDESQNRESYNAGEVSLSRVSS